MVLQNVAQTVFDEENHELKVTSRHKFDQTGFKVLGAVSVLFVQPIAIVNKALPQKLNKESLVSSSLSVITVPTWPGNQVDNRERPQENHVYIESNTDTSNYISQNDIGNPHNVSVIDFSKQNDDFVSTSIQIDSKPQSTTSCQVQNKAYDSLRKNGMSSSEPGHFKSVQSCRQNNVSMQNIQKIKHISSPHDHEMENPVVKGSTMQNIPVDTQGTLNAVNISELASSSDSDCHNGRKQAYVLVRGANKHMKMKSKFFRDRKKMVKCKICDQTLGTCSEIIQHSEFHNLTLECCICKAKFGTACNLRRHCVGHVQTLLFKCSFCHCAYKRKDNLMTHMKKHNINANSRTPIKYSHVTGPLQERRPWMRPARFQQRNPNQNLPVSKPQERSDVQSERNVIEHVETDIQLHPQIDLISVNGKELITNTSQNSRETPSKEQLNHIDLTFDEPDIKTEINLQDVHMDVEKEVEKSISNILNISSSDVHDVSLSQQNMVSGNYLQNQQEQIYHKEKGPSQIVNYSCSTCNISFDNILDLKRHIVLSHSEETNKTVLADTILDRPPNIQNLYTSNTESPELDIGQLGNFTYQFESPVKNKLHQQSQSTSQDNSLKINASPTHIENSAGKMTGPNKFKGLGSIQPVCRICGERFKDIHTALQHQPYHPEQIPMYGCMICTTELSSKESLRRHVRSHMGQEFQCLYCSSKYTRNDNLNTHMKNAHGWIKEKEHQPNYNNRY